MTDNSIPNLFAQAAENTTRIVAGIKPNQWDDPTPCSDWTVRDIVNHLTAENLWVEPLMSGRTLESVGDRYDGDVIGDDPLKAFRMASESAVEAFKEKGAMQKTVNLSFGATQADTYCEQMFIDMLVHGWDVAQGSRQQANVPNELAEAAWAIFEPQAEGWRSAGVIGEAVPSNGKETTTAQLLKLMGRVPA